MSLTPERLETLRRNNESWGLDGSPTDGLTASEGRELIMAWQDLCEENEKLTKQRRTAISMLADLLYVSPAQAAMMVANKYSHDYT